MGINHGGYLAIIAGELLYLQISCPPSSIIQHVLPFLCGPINHTHIWVITLTGGMIAPNVELQ